MNIKQPHEQQRNSAALNPPGEEANQIDSALSQLELSLESPVLPGELSSWAAAVQRASEQLGPILRVEIQENHPDDFAEISIQDSDLIRQVEQLREEDSNLLEQYEQFNSMARRFGERAERAEPHESKLDEQVAAVVDEGLALVIGVRKQEQAISTWLMESFQRDSGVAD